MYEMKERNPDRENELVVIRAYLDGTESTYYQHARKSPVDMTVFREGACSELVEIRVRGRTIQEFEEGNRNGPGIEVGEGKFDNVLLFGSTFLNVIRSDNSDVATVYRMNPCDKDLCSTYVDQRPGRVRELVYMVPTRFFVPVIVGGKPLTIPNSSLTFRKRGKDVTESEVQVAAQ